MSHAGKGLACVVAAWLASAVAGCKSDAIATSPANARTSVSESIANSATPERGAASPAISAGAPREEVHGGIRFLVFFRNGADEESPLVVGMHGRGGSPERFSRVLADFGGRAEIAVAQGPFPLEHGWSWLPGSNRWNDAESVAQFDAVEKKLWAAITELSHGRRVIVTGFSQGGMLSYVLAARHPREIAYAFPISGGAPSELWPQGRAATAPVYALHGTSDDVIDISVARSTIAAFRAQGGTAELHELPGVGHDMPAVLRDDLLTHLQTAVGGTSGTPSSDVTAPRRRTEAAPGVREGDAASKSL